MKKRIHMSPFEPGFRPYDYDPMTVRSWQKVKAPSVKVTVDTFKWCSQTCIGEFSISPQGMAFELEEDALVFKLQYGGNP